MAPPLVFITGASSGIGQALAQRYLRAGWRVALVARRRNVIESWLGHCGASADSYAIYTADVTRTATILAAARACIAGQGLPDVVIANAGISVGMDTARPEDLAVLERVLATNVTGLAATLQPFIAPMVARGSGRLVGIASIAGARGLPGHAAYCASKAAVISYCESLRGELRGSGVRVLTLSPGFVATPLTARNRYPMPFLLQADDFADRAFRAIASRATRRVIPWPMAITARLLPLLPDAAFDRLLAGRARKQREGE